MHAAAAQTAQTLDAPTLVQAAGWVIVAAAIITVSVATISAFSGRGGDSPLVVGWVLSITVSAVAMFTFVMPASEAKSAPQVEATVETIRLAAMANVSTTHGDLFSIRDDDYYQYVTRDEDGGYRLGKKAAEGVKVFEDATPDAARMVTTQCVRQGVDDSIWGDVLTVCGDASTSIHVPEGTVATTFAVDTANG